VEENGLGFTTEQAAAEVDTLMRLFVLLPELASKRIHWLSLIQRFHHKTCIPNDLEYFDHTGSHSLDH
jgi:hypothetical protein